MGGWGGRRGAIEPGGMLSIAPEEDTSCSFPPCSSPWADKEELGAKIQQLEERLNDKREALLEKELILEEITGLSDKLRAQVGEGWGGRRAPSHPQTCPLTAPPSLPPPPNCPPRLPRAAATPWSYPSG